MKPKVEEWIKPGNLTLLKGWARDGLTDAEIARRIGISLSTLYRWKNYEVYGDGPVKAPIRQALKDGKEVIDYAVEGVLLKKAMEGDTTAMIFWLKNRRPDKWRDRQVEAAAKDTDVEDLTSLAELLNEPDTDD